MCGGGSESSVGGEGGEQYVGGVRAVCGGGVRAVCGGG